MEPKKSVFQIYKTEEVKYSVICDNVLLMLSRRIFENKNKEVVYLLENPNKSNVVDKGDNVFVVKTVDGSKYAVKVIFQKITSSGKQSVLSEFIKEYSDYKKIIVANDYGNKIADFASKHGIQMFKEHSMLSDIIMHHDQPIFQLLSRAEMNAVMAEYNATNYTLPKILKSDPIVKYFGLKKANIFRVIRYSQTSGYSPSYRVVA